MNSPRLRKTMNYEIDLNLVSSTAEKPTVETLLATVPLSSTGSRLPEVIRYSSNQAQSLLIEERGELGKILVDNLDLAERISSTSVGSVIYNTEPTKPTVYVTPTETAQAYVTDALNPSHSSGIGNLPYLNK